MARNIETGGQEPEEVLQEQQEVKEIKIESAEQGSKMANELMVEMLKSFPDEKSLNNRLSLSMKREHFTEALETSQQISYLAELSLLQEKLLKGLKKGGEKQLDNFDYSLMLPHNNDVARLDTHLRTPYNNDHLDMESLRRVADLAEIIKQTREIVDPSDEKKMNGAREDLEKAFGEK